MKSIFMINEEYYTRAVGLAEAGNEIGIQLVKVKFEPIKGCFDPLKIKWLPESIKEDICDFPNFRSQFTCMSDKAYNCLKSLIEDSGEFLELYGIELNYTAFHCLTVYDALDKETVSEIMGRNKFFSLGDPSTALPLMSEKIGNSPIFHIPEVRNKFFVNQEFKEIYEKNLLTGLRFDEVPIR